MYDSSFVKGSKAPHQNTDTPQEVGRDKFVPKSAAGAKDGGVGPASGKTSYPPTKQHVNLDTGKVKTNTRKPWAKGGGDKQVSCTAPKNGNQQGPNFSTEKKIGRSEFVPGSRRYGVDGI